MAKEPREYDATKVSASRLICAGAYIQFPLSLQCEAREYRHFAALLLLCILFLS
jgi:hypothetical protein